MLVSKTLTIAAGVVGSIFIGYCFYFDNKRRNHPEYRKNLRSQRKQNRRSVTTKAPFSNLQAVERYFLQEIQLGEALMDRGEYNEAVDHLANAVIVCGRPGRLMQILRANVPSEVYGMLTAKIQEYGNRTDYEELNTISNNLMLDNTQEYLDNVTPPLSINDLE